jgi:hypothetical protein
MDILSEPGLVAMSAYLVTWPTVSITASRLGWVAGLPGTSAARSPDETSLYEKASPMKSPVLRAATVIGGVAAASLAFLPGASQAAVQPQAAKVQHSWESHEVFVQTDGLSGNAVVVYDAAADGTLHAAGTYPTGGLGGQLAGSTIDHLGSQGSLAYDRRDHLLYAVNPGSNTITVFSVEHEGLVRRQVIPSGGTFPVSIAVHDHLVYVLNAREGGSLQGFVRIGDSLVSVPAWHRNLGLDPMETPEFTHTPGQVAFTPDGSKLVVTTKGNGNDIDVFQVGLLGGLSWAPVVSADPDNSPYGITFDSAGHLVVAESGPDAVATFAIKPNGTTTLIDRELTGQVATCWVARDGDVFYASNAGSGTETDYTDNGSGVLTSLGTTAVDAGTTDAAASANGQYLYIRAGAAGIVDEYHVNRGGSLTEIGSVTVPDAVGGQGIATS